MVWTPHVTVAAVIEHEGHFLMIREWADDGGVVINQPAGHLEADESLLDAVRREALEETGYVFEPQGLVGVYLLPRNAGEITYLRFCFHGRCETERASAALDSGIIEALWLSKSELDAPPDPLRSPLVMRCIEDYLAGNRHTLDSIQHVFPK
jgi:8-oxo-dGTP pyrophosphatase MutT (NUDIX family)